jgi:hypothetical protein
LDRNSHFVEALNIRSLRDGQVFGRWLYLKGNVVFLLAFYTHRYWSSLGFIVNMFILIIFNT